MKMNTNWLNEWLKKPVSAEELAERFTMAGLEVDGVEPAAPGFTGICVARIEACEPHPDADKLQVCRVNDGSGELLQIVCGAPNARVGLLAPLARIGAILPGDFKIKKAKLRGVESTGMLCSARELGLSEDHSGLMELPADAPLGQDIREYLDLDDAVLEVDLTPNRADCFCIRGLAREAAVLFQSGYIEPEISPVAEVSGLGFPVVLEAPDDCPRYLGRVIEGVDAKADTPLWMKERLRRCGLRPVSPAVDVTNYVMLELGQPLHAFDLEQLDTGIIVRRANEGEKMTLLDGKEITLAAENLLICDHNGPLALAGIMGGLKSGISDATCNVFLECAWFNPASIMGKARDLGLHTDASHRFERGVDHQLQSLAMERATALMIEIMGGKAGPVTVAEETSRLPGVNEVSLRRERLARLLGIEISDHQVRDILAGLGMPVIETTTGWKVLSPSYRVDIAIEEDLVEEVLRIYGYNNVPASKPGGKLHVETLSETLVPEATFGQILQNLGYQECINYSFISQRAYDAINASNTPGQQLANPLSEDMQLMRDSLLPGLLQSLSRNQHRQQERLRLYESGTVFLELGEKRSLAGVAQGAVWPQQWGVSSRNLDFYDLKGDVENLLAIADDEDIEYQTGELPGYFHPGRSARVMKNGTLLGYMGCLHPELNKAFDYRGDVYAFEFDLSELQKADLPAYSEFSRFPSVKRDLALLVPENMKADELEREIASVAGSMLKNMIVFDVYTGENIEKTYKSVAISLILQEKSRTLVDQDVDTLVETVVSHLKTLGISLRG